MFTGSPRFSGYDCAVCHIDGPQQAQVGLSAMPLSVLSEREYEPGMIYAFEVQLNNETLGLSSNRNFNTFALEILNADQEPVGGFFGFTEGSMSTVDGGNVLFARAVSDETMWQFNWEAPPAGTGYLDFYIAGVDGNGADNAQQSATDPLNDDTFAGAFRIAERGQPAPPLQPQEFLKEQDVTGCAVTRVATPSARVRPWHGDKRPAMPASVHWLMGALLVFGAHRRRPSS